MSLDFLNADYSLRKDVEESALYREVTEGSALTALKIPQVDRPAAFLRDAFANSHRRDRIRFAHGTTTMAFKFQGGIIVAVDSRASMGQCTFFSIHVPHGSFPWRCILAIYNMLLV